MEIKKLNISALVVLKSTIHPGNMSSIKNMYPKVVYNPEFLREKHAKEDFINSYFRQDREAGLEFYEKDSLKLLVERKSKSNEYSGGCKTYLSYLKLSLSEGKDWPRYILEKRGYKYKECYYEMDELIKGEIP